MEQEREEIINSIKWKTGKTDISAGGQSCGIMDTSVRLISEKYDTEIFVGRFRSQIKNKDLAVNMFFNSFQEQPEPMIPLSEAFEFAEYLDNWGWEQIPDGRWQCQMKTEWECKSISELWNQFKEHKTKE